MLSFRYPNVSDFMLANSLVFCSSLKLILIPKVNLGFSDGRRESQNLTINRQHLLQEESNTFSSVSSTSARENNFCPLWLSISDAWSDLLRQSELGILWPSHLPWACEQSMLDFRNMLSSAQPTPGHGGRFCRFSECFSHIETTDSCVTVKCWLPLFTPQSM